MLVVIDEIGSASVPVFVSVTTCAAEVPPTACSPNASELGASVNNGTMAVPDSATALAPAPPPPVTVSVGALRSGGGRLEHHADRATRTHRHRRCHRCDSRRTQCCLSVIARDRQHQGSGVRQRHHLRRRRPAHGLRAERERARCERKQRHNARARQRDRLGARSDCRPSRSASPLFAPALVGLNTTLIVQLAPTATELPQV